MMGVRYHVLNTAGVAMLLQNNSNPIGDWLQVSLVGTVSNRDAYGATVEVWQQGKVYTRYKRSSSSYLSQNDPRLHFGLGRQSIDSLFVNWPNNLRQRVNSTVTGKVVTITESEEANPIICFPEIFGCRYQHGMLSYIVFGENFINVTPKVGEDLMTDLKLRDC